MHDFNDKVAVITGGASGVGRSIALALGRRGAKILVADVDGDALSEVSQSLAAAGVTHLTQHCDVIQQQPCNALAERAFDEFGGAHLVFANAGVAAGEAGHAWEYTEADWRWCFDVNLWGVVHCINAFMPRLVAQNAPAHFVITGSGNGGMVVLQDTPIYTATKAAVQTVAENLFLQVQAMDTPVMVNTLFPGPHVVETGLFNSDRVRPAQFQRADGQAKASGITSVDDMKRMAAEFGATLETTHPDEVAEMAIRHLAEERFWLAEHSEESLQRLKSRYAMLSGLGDPAQETAYAE